MSDKVVGKIFVTSWKNYKKFRDNENNRNLDERHVAKLVASFRKNGWDIEPARNSKRSSAFLEKAALFMLDNGAVPSILKDKLDKYSSTIPKIPSIEVGIETLEGIYNRRSAKKMYFSSAYREYLDNRNKKAERT